MLAIDFTWERGRDIMSTYMNQERLEPANLTYHWLPPSTGQLLKMATTALSLTAVTAIGVRNNFGSCEETKGTRTPKEYWTKINKQAINSPHTSQERWLTYLEKVTQWTHYINMKRLSRTVYGPSRVNRFTSQVRCSTYLGKGKQGH